MKQYLRYRIKEAQLMDGQSHPVLDTAWAAGSPTTAVPLSPEDASQKRKQFYRRLLGYGLVSGGGYILGASTSAALAELVARSKSTQDLRMLSTAEKMRKFGPYIGLATGAAGLATALMWANSKRKAEEDSGFYDQEPSAPEPITRQNVQKYPPARYPHVSNAVPAMPISRIYSKIRVGRLRDTVKSTMMAEPKPGEFDLQ
jgi:hypothetical protein